MATTLIFPVALSLQDNMAISVFGSQRSLGKATLIAIMQVFFSELFLCLKHANVEVSLQMTLQCQIYLN